MCGRFKSGHLDWQGYRALLESVSLQIINDNRLNFEDREEIRPTDDAVIVRQASQGVELAKARWWLIPFFYKGALKEWKATTFNAKAETIKTAPSYREAFKHRRCLVPASGWWEWKDEGGSRGNERSRPDRKLQYCHPATWRAGAPAQPRTARPVEQRLGALDRLRRNSR